MTTDLTAKLDAIDARVEAATEGPWFPDEDDASEGHAVYQDDGGFGTVYIAQEMHQGHDEGRGDAEFIAHARQDVPAMSAALRAVLDLHVSDEWPDLPFCKGCYTEFPCATRLAITTHLEGAS